MTQKSGLLDVHVDGNYHDATGLNRRINLLIYLNSNWQKSWKGELGLYDKTGKNFITKTLLFPSRKSVELVLEAYDHQMECF